MLHKYSNVFILCIFYVHNVSPPVIVFQQDNDRLKQGRITIEEFRTIYRIIAHREEIIEIFNTYSENRKFLFEKNLAQFLTQEQYTLDINKSIASEIIQKYEPIEEGMLVFQSFIKYLYANYFLRFALIKFKFLIRSDFLWVIYIGCFNFIFYRQQVYLLESFVVLTAAFFHCLVPFFQLLLYISQVFRDQLIQEKQNEDSITSTVMEERVLIFINKIKTQVQALFHFYTLFY